jgi:hypothetical protein
MKKITTASIHYLVESCTAAAKSSTQFLNQIVKRPATSGLNHQDKIFRGKILDHRHSHKNDIIF